MNKGMQISAGCLALAASLLLAGLPASATGSRQSERIEISFGYWDIDTMASSQNPDGLTAFLEEKFGFAADAVSFNWNSYQQQYKILATAGDLPDVFTTVFLSSSDADNTAAFNQMVENGSIRPIPEDLSEYPNLEALLERFEGLRGSDGHRYAIPHPVFEEPILSSSDAAMLVRRDWMENLGLENPESIEDFIRLAAAFANEDPDGNGLDDTAGYNVNSLNALGKWVILGIAPECNVYSWIEADDGTFFPSWLTEEFHDVVSVYRTLYETGGLDPAFCTKNPAAVVDDFVSGRLGALEFKSSVNALAELEGLWNAKNTAPFAECVDVLPIFPAADGKRYSNSSNSFWSETYISSSVTDEQLSIILSLMDYLLSEEGSALYTFGIPEEDYTVGKNGVLVSLLESEASSSHFESLRGKYPSLELWMNLANTGWGRDSFEISQENCFLYGDAAASLAKKALDDCAQNTIQVSRPYDFLTFPKEHASFDADAFDAFIQCIIGTEEPLEMWEAALAQFYDQGLAGYITRQNILYKQSR